MKFVVDSQLPLALSRFLRDRGYDSEHVDDIGMNSASDVAICKYACAQDRIIISKDEDFLYLSRNPDYPIRFIWVRLGNCRTKVLLEAFASLWPMIEASIKAGDHVIEIR